MSDHAKGCTMAGCYSVTTCPCCSRRITPVRQRHWLTERELDEVLRERPASGLFDVEGEMADA